MPSTIPYFAFGSNLWLDQMASRCPDSPLTGIACLRNYKWFINARGYANIAPSRPRSRARSNSRNSQDGRQAAQEEQPDDEVWGLLYTLSPADEAQLDRNEGVPHAYEKWVIPCEVWPIGPGEAGSRALRRGEPGRVVDVLVYIDLKRNRGGHQPRAEYVHRMNMGIRDAVVHGVPGGYVREVLREYIPDEEEASGEVR